MDGNTAAGKGLLSSRLGLTLSIPFGARHSLKLTYSEGATTRRGNDFESFMACEAYAAESYRNKRDWSRRALYNIAGASRFSSDATIRQYAAEIWNLQPVKTDFGLLEKET